MTRHLAILALMAVLLPLKAIGGGSYEPVVVESIAISNGDDYLLVVRPQASNVPGYKDPYLGNCSLFTVHGTFSKLHSLSFPKRVTQENHRSALEYLRQAQQRRQTIYFGWMGTGFVPLSSDTPCVVRSRALELDTEEGRTFVLSYHNPV